MAERRRWQPGTQPFIVSDDPAASAGRELMSHALPCDIMLPSVAAMVAGYKKRRDIAIATLSEYDMAPAATPAGAFCE